MTGAVLSRTRLIQYGFLAMPVAFAGFPLYVLAPDYYATQFGLSLSLLGLILLGLRAFDAVQDPFIGTLIDRFPNSSVWFMPVSAVVLCVSIYGLFNHVPSSPAVWFALCMAIAVSSYSILSINLNSLGALWTENPQDQTRIAGYREGFGLIGLVIAVSAPGLLSQIVDKGQVYVWFSVLLVVAMTGGIVLFQRWHSKRDFQSGLREPATGLKHTVRHMSLETRRLFTVYAISMIASSIPAVLVLFFVRDFLGLELYTGLFLLIYFCAGVASMPLWERLSRHFGKARAWLFSILLAVGAFIWAFSLQAGDGWQYAIICLFSGLALGADLSLPPSLLADQIHRHDAGRQAATHYSFLALISKASLALASAIVLPLLDAAGFVPGATNSHAALLALCMAYAVLPCFLKLGAGFMLYRFFIHSRQGVSHENHQLNSTNGSSHHV